MAKVTVREATIGLLRLLGMRTIFGNPGSTELPLFKQFPPDFRYVMSLQEASAVGMADGYAQATGNAAFVNLHSATGVGNALGNLFTSYRNQTPLVITAGQQTRAMLPTAPYLYATSAQDFPKPYVKWSCEPARAQDVPAAIARAYYTAMQKPCGPTFVSIPIDDWDEETETVDPRAVSFAFAPDPDALRRVADAINRSERPAIVVGSSVDRDGAWDAVVRLAERTRAAVWESPLASRASFPEDHPLFAGFLPAVRSSLAAKLAGNDLVLVLGAPVFTYHVHSEGPFIPEGARLFLLTDDPEAAAWAPVGDSVLTSLRLGVEALLEMVETSTCRPTAPRPALPVPQPSDPISPQFVLHTIARLMPDDTVIVEEAPTHRNAMHDYLPIREPGGFFVGASGGLGWGLPAAVGVSLADPSRRVICLLGDGSSMYSIQALWNAARDRLPVTFIVLNNGRYGALESFNQILGTGPTLDFGLPGIDIVAIARGFGCKASRVEKAADFEAALASALAAQEPVLLDVAVDPAIPRLY